MKNIGYKNQPTGNSLIAYYIVIWKKLLILNSGRTGDFCWVERKRESLTEWWKVGTKKVNTSGKTFWEKIVLF